MKLTTFILGLTLSFCAGTAAAAVAEADAAKLGADLTPVGAERSGNPDGSIPEWSGGDMKPPAGWKRGQPRPDPYGGDKPLFSITASNVEQYRDKLSVGQAEMIRTIPGYRMDVYPSHRSCGFPDFYYERTKKNATIAKVAADGYNLSEALGAAVPFPIPQSGAEAMWNHKLQWKGEGFHMSFAGYIPPKGSDQIGDALAQEEWDTSPMWSPKNKGVADARGLEFLYLQTFTAPPSIAGDATLAHYNLARPNDLWLYFASLRRVRRAPTYQYDAPQINTENLLIVDQYYMFNGPLDRYDFKLAGKKELYVPYNLFRLNSTKNQPEDVVKPKFLSRDLMRYEQHRVWVVEATLKSGKRHLFPKRTFYIDEDTWHILVADMYDAKGKVWRVLETGPFMVWEIPACVSAANMSWDFQAARGVFDRIFAGYPEADWLAVREGRLKESTFEPSGLRRFTKR